MNIAVKTLLAAFFLLSMAPGTAIAQSMQFNIELSNQNPQPGEQVEVSFIAENAANLFYYGLEVGYEPARTEFAGIQPGSLMGSNPLSIADNLNETTIGASVVRTSGTGEGDGEVVTLRFNIAENAAPGPLSFTIQNPDVRNGAGNPIAVVVPSGFTLNVQPESEDTRTVVFQVDMSVQRQSGNFDTGLNDIVYARGAFNGWSLDNPMTLVENDIYEAVVEISGPQGQDVAYKFFIEAGNGRELPNGGWENFDGDRTFALGEPDLVQVLDKVFFSNQLPDQQPELRPVVFRVNLQYYIDPEIDLFNPTFMDVYVRGSFNNFSLADQMEVIDDAVYELTVMVPGNEGDSPEFKFFVFVPEEFSEFAFPNDGWELLNDDPDLNRSFELGPAGQTQDLGMFFFNDMVPPEPQPFRPVSFFVDMSVQEQLGNFQPESGDEVFVRGSFNDSNFGELVPMLLTSNSVYTAMPDIFGDEGEEILYKFFLQAGDNRDLPNGGWEIIPDRSFILGEGFEPQELPVVFFDDLEEVPQPAVREVVFSVDMSVQTALGNFTPGSDDIIALAGTFNDWSAVALSESGVEGIYSITLSLEGQEGASEFYKFVLNNDFELEGLDNRSFTLGPPDVQQVLPVVFYDDNDQMPEPEPVRPVTFSVNMSVQQALGFFDPALGDEVNVRGNINGTNFMNNFFMDPAGNGIFDVTIDVEGETGLPVEFKFLVQAGDGRELPNGGWEVIDDNPTLNRSFTLGDADEPQVLDTFFFNNDEGTVVPEPEVRNVTFLVDMSVQQASGFYQPEVGDEVWVGASFNGFQPVNQMTLVADGVYSIGIDVEGDEGLPVEYKFFITAGDDRELPFGGFEQIGDSPTINRVFELGPDAEPQILPQVFFGDEEPVEPEIVIVWPGDTNNDGVVNEQDVLPLGIYWNLTGPARENASTEWAGQPAVVWEPLEATFADTDGSGLVNQTDLLAVGLNFGNTHGDAVSESGPIAEEILPALQPGDRVLITLSAPSETLIQGLSYAFGVDGAAPETYMVSSYEIGSWGEVWQGTGRLIEFDTVREGILSGARVHRGQTQAQPATELFSIEIDVIQPISAGAAFFVQRVAYVSEAASIENFETIVLDIEVQTGSSASDGTELPAFTQLHQNYPNPFNPTTNISFDLSAPATVTIEVVNILGQRVAVLASREDLSAGSHVRVFDAGRLNSGVYLVRMTTGSESFTRKMMLVK